MRAEADPRPDRWLLAVVVLLALVTGGCGGHDSKKRAFVERLGPSSGCALAAASGSAQQSGDVMIDVELTSLVSVTMSFSWSTDGGASFTLAMPALDSPLANPAAGVTAGPGLAFVWNSAADLPGTPPVATLLRLQASPAGECVLALLVGNVHEPTCALDPPAQDPAVARPVLTLLPLDVEADRCRVTLGYSLDGGASFSPATIAATSGGARASFVPTDPGNPFPGGGDNQAIDLPANIATMLTWDALADGVGVVARQDVLVIAWVEDGTTAGAGPFSSCSTTLEVLASAAPACTILSPTGGQLSGPVDVDLDVSDADDGMVQVAFEFSTDGGVTHAPCSAAASSPVPSPAMVATGNVRFVWDADLDLAGVASLPVRLRVRVDDGVDPGGTRPASCQVAFAWGTAVVETLLELRAVTVLGARGGPVPGAPAPGNPRGDYGALDDRELDEGISLPAGDSPALLLAAGDVYRPVIEGTMAIAGSVDLSDATSALGATTYLSDDPAVVSVASDGTLTAMTGNACTFITASFVPDASAVPGGAPASVRFAACCDLAGVDHATRTAGGRLAAGELDADLPGLPSGPPAPGAGGTIALILHVATGGAELAAHSVTVDHDDTILQIDASAPGSVQGVSGSSTSYGGPTAVNDSVSGTIGFNHFYLGAPVSGVLDLATVHFGVLTSGLAAITTSVNTLGDPAAAPIGAPGPRLCAAASGAVRFP